MDRRRTLADGLARLAASRRGLALPRLLAVGLLAVGLRAELGDALVVAWASVAAAAVLLEAAALADPRPAAGPRLCAAVGGLFVSTTVSAAAALALITHGHPVAGAALLASLALGGTATTRRPAPPPRLRLIYSAPA